MAPSLPQARLAKISQHVLPSIGPASTASVDGTVLQPGVPTDRVDKAFSKFFAAGRAPGLAYGLVVDGKLVHVGGFGTLHVGKDHPPGPDSMFRIASMTKSFLAATVLLLRDEGKLRLDDALEHWVPELRGLPLATADSAPPTVRQLLSMNAGYPEDDPWADRLESLTKPEYTAFISESKSFSHSPGVAFEYSNFGYTLLGRVVQNATGRPFRDVVNERIIQPLGMKSTTWSDDGVDPARVATGYALVDGAWAEQPIQKPGEFSAMAGLYSTVEDLAIWVAGFMDAWPARDEVDKHPLSRASRREMQHVITAMPLALGRGDGLSRVKAVGYCMGLFSYEDLTTGRIFGHPGGYPGFGSDMSWHPVKRIGVIALANGRYAGPSGANAAAIAAVAAESPHRLLARPHSAVEEIRRTINKALVAGNFALLEPLLAGNVDLDEAISRRAKQVAGLRELHGALTPEDRLRVAAPMHVTWWLAGERGRVGVEIMLTPELPTKVQTLNITSVQPATAGLKGALDTALKHVKQGMELSFLLLPLRHTSWVVCDGARSGTVLIEGVHADVYLSISVNPDGSAVTTFTPDQRHWLRS